MYGYRYVCTLVEKKTFSVLLFFIVRFLATTRDHVLVHEQLFPNKVQRTSLKKFSVFQFEIVFFLAFTQVYTLP